MNEIQKKNFINKIIKFMQYLNLNNDFLVNYLSIEQMYYIEREYRKVCKIKYPKRIKEYQENYRKKNRDKIRIYHREYKRKTKQKEYQNLKIKKQKMYEMVRDAPDFYSIQKQVYDIVKDNILIIYNAYSDLQWFSDLEKECDVICCMLAFTRFIGEQKFVSLKRASEYVNYKLPENLTPHRALADCYSTRAVFYYIRKNLGCY